MHAVVRVLPSHNSHTLCLVARWMNGWIDSLFVVVSGYYSFVGSFSCLPAVLVMIMVT